MASTNRNHVHLVVKLGGSAITDKDQLETLKESALSDVANMVEKCVKMKMKCIIVHGAGSFGHHQAKEFKVNEGFNHVPESTSACVKLGFCLTRKSVLKLNTLVVDSLLSRGVSAVACSPCSSWQTDNKIVTKSGVNCIEHLLDSGFVPVLHGDCVLDSQLGCCILSGDTIIKTLCQEFSVDKIVFLTDVLGIFDQPPDRAGAQLLSQIRVSTDGTLQATVATSHSENDVTGGIKLKLQTAIDVVNDCQGETKVYICQIGSPSAETVCIYDDFEKQTFTGTEILAASEYRNRLI